MTILSNFYSTPHTPSSEMLGNNVRAAQRNQFSPSIDKQLHLKLIPGNFKGLAPATAQQGATCPARVLRMPPTWLAASQISGWCSTSENTSWLELGWRAAQLAEWLSQGSWGTYFPEPCKALSFCKNKQHSCSQQQQFSSALPWKST